MFDTSSAGNKSLKAAPQPAGPACYVLPEPITVSSLLIKPASTRHEPLQTFGGRAHLAGWMNMVSCEIWDASPQDGSNEVRKKRECSGENKSADECMDGVAGAIDVCGFAGCYRDN